MEYLTSSIFVAFSNSMILLFKLRGETYETLIIGDRNKTFYLIKKLTQILLIFIFTLGVNVPSNAGTVNLSCISAANSYVGGPSFDMKFENELALIKEVELCFLDCKRSKEPAEVYPVTEKSEHHLKFLTFPKGDLPEDAKNWKFSFDEMTVSYVYYQFPFLGTSEEWKAMGLVGEPSKTFVKLGDISFQCRTRRTKIIN